MKRQKIGKVPLVTQLEPLEGGYACLAMILAYHRKLVSLGQIKADCGSIKKVPDLDSISQMASFYGLEAERKTVSFSELCSEDAFPCIVTWDRYRYVVIAGVSRSGKYIVNDPANGVLLLDEDNVASLYAGTALCLKPGAAFRPEGKQSSVMAFARERLAGTHAAVAFVVITTFIASILAVINPAFSRVFMDYLLDDGGGASWLNAFIILLSAIVLIRVIADTIKAVYSYRIYGKMAVVGSSTFMWHLLHLPFEFFTKRFTGDLISRQKTNSTIAETLVNTLAPIVLNAFTMILFFIMMMRYNVLLSLIGVASIAINLCFTNMVARRRLSLSKLMSKDSSRLKCSTVNGIEMIETIKASGAENGYFEHWSGYQSNVNTKDMNSSNILSFYTLLASIVSGLTDIIILSSGVYLIMQGEFTTGMLMAFQSFLASFVAPAQSLLAATQTIQEMRNNMDTVNEVMKYPLDPAAISSGEADETADKLSGNIEFRNVTFGYSRLAPPYLNNVSFSVKSGQKIAVVGASGSGKSTISKLLSGLYPPWEGEILFDGRRIDEISHSVFTGSVAVVDQDIILFEDTIANNIRMWDSTIEDYEVILAARDAQIHDEIISRVGGYQYRITEGGRDFSGGERQRLEIARVLAQDPTIIIMDEATSALDADTEYKVVNAIKARGITCIIIAHRLSTVRDCDEILVLDQGQIAERGTHEELFSRGGLYTKLILSE